MQAIQGEHFGGPGPGAHILAVTIEPVFSLGDTSSSTDTENGAAVIMAGGTGRAGSGGGETSHDTGVGAETASTKTGAGAATGSSLVLNWPLPAAA